MSVRIENEEHTSTVSPTFVHSKKFRLLLLICVLFAGGYKWWGQLPVYESQLALVYHNANKRTFGEVAQKLDILAQRRSWETLASELHISRMDAGKILRIIPADEEGKPLYSPGNAKEYAPIYFTVVAADRSIYKKLEPSLVNYFNSCSPSTALAKQRELIDNQARVTYMEHNLGLLDSIIDHYSSMTRQVNMLTDTSILSLNHIFTYKTSLEEQILAQKRRLAEMNDNVEVLHSFLPPEYPVDNRPITIFLTLAVMAIIWFFPARVVSRQLNYGKNGIKKSAKIAAELLRP